MTGWQPVHGKDGKVLGWMADASWETPQEAAQRVRVAAERAAAVGEVAGLLGDECFDVDSVFDTARENGVSEAVLDSAGYLAVELMSIERLRA